MKLTLDPELTIRTIHPDDEAELFALIERNRARLRPWVHPSALPETTQATYKYAVECYLWSLDPLTAIDSPYVDLPYFPPPQPCWELGILYCGKLVGIISLLTVPGRDYGTAEIGYWIAAEHEGKGIVTRCVVALMERAIEEWKIDRFIIGSATVNQRSRAIPERLGYELMEIVPNGEVNGDCVYDRAVYTITASAWRERRAPPSGA